MSDVAWRGVKREANGTEANVEVLYCPKEIEKAS